MKGHKADRLVTSKRRINIYFLEGKTQEKRSLGRPVKRSYGVNLIDVLFNCFPKHMFTS
jgi:hypothetical protein